MAATISLSRQAAIGVPFLRTARLSQPEANWRRIWTVGRVTASASNSRRGYAAGKRAKGTKGAMMRQVATELKRQSSEMIGDQSPSLLLSKGESWRDVSNISVKLIDTFITPPLSKWPRQPREFFSFAYEWARARIMNVVAINAIRFQSKPKWNRRAMFRPPSASSIIPMAKHMHQTMSEAIAAGDKNTLNSRVCVAALAEKLCATIDARPRGRRYEWELVRYNGRPKLCERKVQALSVDATGHTQMMVLQAVVRIKSRQRLVQYDDRRGGAVVPGSKKEVDLVENVILSTVVDPDTFQLSEWRILGTVPDTTPEEWAKEKALVDQVQVDQVAQQRKARG